MRRFAASCDFTTDYLMTTTEGLSGKVCDRVCVCLFVIECARTCFARVIQHFIMIQFSIFFPQHIATCGDVYFWCLLCQTFQ